MNGCVLVFIVKCVGSGGGSDGAVDCINSANNFGFLLPIFRFIAHFYLYDFLYIKSLFLWCHRNNNLTGLNHKGKINGSSHKLNRFENNIVQLKWVIEQISNWNWNWLEIGPITNLISSMRASKYRKEKWTLEMKRILLNGLSE